MCPVMWQSIRVGGVLCILQQLTIINNSVPRMDKYVLEITKVVHQKTIQNKTNFLINTSRYNCALIAVFPTEK